MWNFPAMNKNNNNSVPKSTLIWKNIPCISIHPYSVVLLFLFIKAHSSARKHTENLSVKDLIIGKISVPTKVLTRQLCSLQNNRNETITQNQNKGKEAHARVYILTYTRVGAWFVLFWRMWVYWIDYLHLMYSLWVETVEQKQSMFSLDTSVSYLESGLPAS